MRYVAAYLLAVLGGNKNPSTGDIEKILSSVGIESEKDKLEKIIKELNGKDVKDVVEQGKQKLSSVVTGAVVAATPVAAASGGGGGGAAAASSAPPAKKEEKKEEPKEEESDEDMGFGLFD